MNIMKPCKTTNHLFLHHHFNSETRAKAPRDNIAVTHSRGMKVGVVRASSGSGEGIKPEKPSFLSYQEAGIVEMSGLVSHEKFLCRLTISSLNLLRVISEQEGCSIEELNAGRICDWFLKDKLKSEQNLDTAVLQWDDSDLQL